MARNSEQGDGPQGRRARRSRKDRERRDAAFAPKQRGRPKGSVLSFREDDDRFAIAMIYCGECFLGMPRYHAAYIAVALTSGRAVNAAAVDNVAVKLSGCPKKATLKGGSFSLIAKCDRNMTVADADWIASSAALLGRLVKLHVDPALTPDPTVLRAVFDDLAVRGWLPTLLKIAKKLSAVGTSNFPPSDEPVSARVQTWLSRRSSNSKS